MLFDLRARGRRTTVRVVYIGLALLIGLGLVGFGIGGGFGSGGILSAASKEGEGGGGVSYSDQISKYKKLTAQQPGNAAAWEKLVNAQLHQAGGEAYVTATGVTSKGKELFTQIGQFWNRYLALNPAKPNPELAQEMVRVYGEEGLNQPAEAVRALQIAIAAQPGRAVLYRDLAIYAYKAHNVREGDLASAKAVALAPAAQRTRLQTELAALKKNPSGGETATATTNGKTFTVKSSGKGSFTGTAPATTIPAPSKK